MMVLYVTWLRSIVELNIISALNVGKYSVLDSADRKAGSMRTRFYNLCKGEIDFLIENCNFTDDERILIEMASKRKSDLEIADRLSISTSLVTKRKKKIMQKILEFLKGDVCMTTIYVNGQRVDKKDLEKMEINVENVKKILSEKLTKNK